ncbi:MAG: PIG-L family deacetylase [Candidatus Brocadiae bacterium]|nr:PIG-L family deacetylase [Candidatus Brocadiia bacterium]
MKKSICAVVAHADDVEFGSGGTVARYAAEGYRVLYGLLTRCNSGRTHFNEQEGGRYQPSVEIDPMRYAEAQAAAKVFGAEFWYGDLLENIYTRKDGSLLTPSYTGAEREGVPADDIPEGTPIFVAAGPGLWPDHPIVGELADLLVQWEPELVIGQAIQNGNPDHFAAALVVARAWRRAAEDADIGPYWLPVSAPGPGRFQFPPLSVDEIVDVTGYEETALKALACHRSQGGHLQREDGHLWRKWRYYGEKIGAASAEGFKLIYSK